MVTMQIDISVHEVEINMYKIHTLTTNFILFLAICTFMSILSTWHNVMNIVPCIVFDSTANSSNTPQKTFYTENVILT